MIQIQSLQSIHDLYSSVIFVQCRSIQFIADYMSRWMNRRACVAISRYVYIIIIEMENVAFGCFSNQNRLSNGGENKQWFSIFECIFFSLPLIHCPADWYDQNCIQTPFWHSDDDVDVACKLDQAEKKSIFRYHKSIWTMWFFGYPSFTTWITSNVNPTVIMLISFSHISYLIVSLFSLQLKH